MKKMILSLVLMVMGTALNVHAYENNPVKHAQTTTQLHSSHMLVK